MWDAMRRDDPFVDEVDVYTVNSGVTQCLARSVQRESLVRLNDLVVLALPRILELALCYATTIHNRHLLQELSDLPSFCREIMLDKRAGPVAVVALIVAILWLKLLVKVTENEHTSTIRFIGTISSDTFKLGDLALDLGIRRFFACGIVGVGISKHLFDFDGITKRVD